MRQSRKPRCPIRATSTHALVEQVREQRKTQAYGIRHYALPGLVQANTRLILVITSRGDGTLSLVESTLEGPHMRVQECFSEQEAYLLSPLLDAYPNYCPYEVLLAHFYAAPTEIQIAHYRKEVIQALGNGTVKTLLRGPRNVLSRTRLKVRLFGIEISGIFQTGYQLRPIADRLRESV